MDGYFRVDLRIVFIWDAAFSLTGQQLSMKLSTVLFPIFIFISGFGNIIYPAIMPMIKQIINSIQSTFKNPVGHVTIALIFIYSERPVNDILLL